MKEIVLEIMVSILLCLSLLLSLTVLKDTNPWIKKIKQVQIPEIIVYKGIAPEFFELTICL